jgi:hypothetical protein
MKQFFISLFIVLTAYQVSAGDLSVHAVEIGIGKFHRMDNAIHPYGAKHAWLPLVLPANTEATPSTVENPDGSVTIFYSNLEQLLREITMVSGKYGGKVKLLNIHTHGLPGGLGFPKDDAEQNSPRCTRWRNESLGPDKPNYDHYYSALTREEILSIRRLGQYSVPLTCVTDLSAWQTVAPRITGLRESFAPAAQVNFLACLVGLGPVGRRFLTGVGRLLLPGGGYVRATEQFGMVDWSVPQGMGFWDFLNDSQLKKDMALYPVKRQDSLFLQKGTIAVAAYVGGKWANYSLLNQNFMKIDLRPISLSKAVPIPDGDSELMDAAEPEAVRIPGTEIVAYPE